MNSLLINTVVAIILVLTGLVYIKTAKKLGIVDVPNNRSSHDGVIVRGGGILIPLAVIIYAVLNLHFNGFILGLFLVSTISFIDDLKNLSGKWRMLAQTIAVIILFMVVIGNEYPVWISIFVMILMVGTINAVNFMDGINGITAVFGVVSLVTLIFLNNKITFVEQELLFISLIGVMAFGYFNFRKQAKCFAGDVGSVSLGYILIYFTLVYYKNTGNLSVIVLWSVYGIDTVLTIVHRIINKENIFNAHRLHLYQYYANELGKSHMSVSTVYGITQMVINVFFVLNLQFNFFASWLFITVVLLGGGILYVFLRIYVLRKIKVIQSQIENEVNF